jgi:flavin reductase (DIM6/NTAB) family NADH-FMN oxidoreductase RutF
MDPTIDQRQFRASLGRFATGVTIITARGTDGRPIGLTCNSFGSLSLSPPLVQWCIGNSSRNYAAINSAKYFAVHVLDSTQQDLCRRFANLELDRFANLELAEGLHSLPLLNKYHARFECERHSLYRVGDHTIVVGQVLRLDEQDGDPLLFYRGTLTTVTLPSQSPKSQQG